jgi:RNA polymerase sigma factor (sigma-70 family)
MGEDTSTRIANAAKSIYTYCRNRTSTKEEAEDLSQDILLELLKSQGSLRNDKAFYGFMWAVAGNVYKNWCKKRKNLICELDDKIPDDGIPFTDILEKESDIRRLQRELKLLPEQYRKVVVMYYFDGMKVAEIANSVNITESMVKFLLFKSRKILKEGFNMERTFGEQSFNPARMTLRFFAPNGNWSKWVEPTYFERNILAQNILLTCYNEPCTAEEISLQLGISVPYLEKDLQELCDTSVLVKEKNRYETDIVIFTKEFSSEVLAKTANYQKEIADILTGFLDERLDEFKKIGFFTGDSGDDSLLRWRIAHLILEQSVLNESDSEPNVQFTKQHNGHPIFLWGSEGEKYSCLAMGFDNENGDKMQFLEFLPATWLKMFSWGYFWNRNDRVKLMLDIANGKQDGFDENEKNELAELIKLGFLEKDGDKISLRIPIYTASQFAQALSLTADTRNKISKITEKIIEISKDILVQHSPATKKKEAKSIAWLKKREISMDRPVEIMLGSGELRRTSENEHPAAYVVLK